jgi:hypothetical protein
MSNVRTYNSENVGEADMGLTTGRGYVQEGHLSNASPPMNGRDSEALAGTLRNSRPSFPNNLHN